MFNATIEVYLFLFTSVYVYTRENLKFVMHASPYKCSRTNLLNRTHKSANTMYGTTNRKQETYIRTSRYFGGETPCS